ncbi:general substrate transporter [Lipomyces kononenkoae]|uniref:General substrate transporter n=1 Tax=Lipomyces kononenkoae TaxID=34357 RepID=A0ACC3T709_LIPKO
MNGNMGAKLQDLPRLDRALEADSAHSWTSPHLLKLNFCALSLALFASANGFDVSLMNGLQSLPQWQSFMSIPTGAWLGFVNIVYWLGMLFTYLFSASLSNRFGRKIGLYIGVVVILVAAALQAAAPNQAIWIVARTLAGCAAGFWSSTAPILITEIAYPSHRPIITALYQCGFYLGSLLSAIVTLRALTYTSSWAWRVPSLLQALLPLISVPGLLLCPESPRWLVSRDRLEQARSSLAKWHADGDISAPLVNSQMNEIYAALVSEKEASSASYLDMVKTKGNRRRLLITLSLALFSQWCGNGVVSYYLAKILGTVGITSAKSQLIITVSLQVSNLLCAVIAACFVGRIGKRLLFRASAVMMLVSYVLITGLSGSFAENGHAAIGIAVIPFLFIFFAGYAIALTPLLIAYPCEIWQFNLRSRGLTLTWIAAVVFASFNGLVNPIALDAIQWKYYFLFLGVLITYGITAHFLYPETRGYSLERIGVLFDEEIVIVDGQTSSIGINPMADESAEKH